MATLYIVPTPIGNLQDITIRAVKILTSVPVIACEDTRRTGLLLDHLKKTYLENAENFKKPRLISYYEERDQSRVPDLLSILKNGEEVALITDAGTPTISDPGFRLVKACHVEDIPVVGLPGASSVTLALSVSGLPTDKFTFYGYLPEKESHAKKLLENIKETEAYVVVTHIIFASPHKIVKNLDWVREVLGDIEIVVCSELTKIYEKVEYTTISNYLDKLSKDKIRGEYVILWHK